MPVNNGKQTSNGNTGTDTGVSGEWTQEDMEEAVPLPMPEVDDEDPEQTESGDDST